MSKLIKGAGGESKKAQRFSICPGPILILKFLFAGSVAIPAAVRRKYLSSVPSSMNRCFIVTAIRVLSFYPRTGCFNSHRNFLKLVSVGRDSYSSLCVTVLCDEPSPLDRKSVV